MADNPTEAEKKAASPVPIFLRMREVSALIGLKPHAIDRAIRAGQFPRPFRIGVRTKAWSAAELDAWIEERGRARDDYADPAVPNPLTEEVRAARYEAQAAAV
jgi:prophage regulatory protein